MYTDIFVIDRKSEHICDIISNNDIIKKIKTLKPKQRNDYTIYVHHNLYLIIDLKTKMKTCERIENIHTTITDDNIMYTTSKITKLSLESFPIINTYDAIFNRTVVIYENNVLLIQDDDGKTKNKTSFLRIENDTSVAIQAINKLN